MTNTLSSIEKSYIQFQVSAPQNQTSSQSSTLQKDRDDRNYSALFTQTECAFKELKKRIIENNDLSPLRKCALLGSRLLVGGSIVGLVSSGLGFPKKMISDQQSKGFIGHCAKNCGSKKLISSLGLLAIVGKSIEICTKASQSKTEDLLNDSKSKIISELVKRVWEELEEQENLSRLQIFFKNISTNFALYKDEKTIANELFAIRLCWLNAYKEFINFEKKYLQNSVGTDFPKDLWYNFDNESVQIGSFTDEEVIQKIDQIDQLDYLCTKKIKNLTQDFWVAEQSKHSIPDENLLSDIVPA